MPSQLKQVCRLEGHTWECSSVHFHPAGNMVASASWDRTVRIWDVEERKALRTIERGGHSGPITCVRWHPNGALLATTSSDNTTCLWDASTGERMRVLREHFGWVLQCSFAPDRTKLATASWDKTVRIWDPNTGELISTLRGHTKGVRACEFYPVGHSSALLATAGEDATARLWDTRTRKVALTLSGGHADAIYSVAWSNDGSMIATGSADRTVTIWDPKAGKILRLLKAHEGTVKSALFLPTTSYQSSNLLATAGGYTAILWNPSLPTSNLLAEARHHDPGKEVESVSISYNGRLMATGGRDGAVSIVEIPSGKSEDYDAEPSGFKQTKAAESWLQGKPQTTHVPTDRKQANIREQEQMATLKSAMTDERAAWMKRAQSQFEPRDETEPETQANGHKPRVNSSKLLESRGFTKSGLKQDPNGKEAESAEVQEPLAEVDEAQEIADSAESEEPVVETESARRQRATAMLDDRGKVHPMIAASRKQAGKPEQRQAAPPSGKVSDVDGLMAMLRDKTEESAVVKRNPVRRTQSRPVSMLNAGPIQDASVEELLDMSKPVLDRRPKVRNTSSVMFPKD
eukprot:m.80487 g.80487  ORF g.80487 m.80487 type:complete len:575 (+) comp12604_c0_seq1:86-1810(+)